MFPEVYKFQDRVPALPALQGRGWASEADKAVKKTNFFM